MKKIMFLGGLFLSAMTFVGCSDDFTDWASPQTNPQEDAIELPGYTASAVTTPIDLSTVAGDSVQVLTLSDAALPEGAVVSNTRIELLPDGDETATAVTLAVDNEGRVGKADLQATIEGFYGKRPEARTLNGHVYSNIVLNSQAFLVDAQAINVVATPDAPFIASAYYIVGNMTDWFNGDPIKFSHSDVNVYDDPVFTVSFTAPADCYWKIIPQNNIDSGDLEHTGEDGVVGVAENGDVSMEGSLVTGDGVGAGRILNAGMYRMTINMMEYTYKIEEMAATYYLVGDFGGAASWDISNFNYALYPQTTTTQSYTTKWTGSGSFKFFTEANNWDSAYGAELGTTAGAASGKLASNANNGADNISVPEVGAYYTFTVDIVNMNFTWTKLSEQAPKRYPTMNLSGDFNGWGIGGDGEMHESTPHNWYVDITIASDGSLKFRSAENWDDGNWGGNGSVNIGETNYGTAVFGGGNINVPAGKYKVYFNDITGQFLFLAE